MILCLGGHAYLAWQLGLSVDEAHYALYAANPALSYFDHPPLVGWLQIPFVWLVDVLGSADWPLRVVPFVLWSITAWALWRLSKRVEHKIRAGSWALILFLLSPIHHLLGLALVPDTLLLPLTLWVMVLTWKLSTNHNEISHWLWLGVALGLSGLSKYTGVFLAISCAVMLLSSHGLALLKARGLWLAALIAAVMISPVLIWNAQNDWISLTYQLNHAGGVQRWQWASVLRFDAVQLLSYGSLPLVGLVVFLWKLQTLHKRLMWLCLVFGLPTLLLATYSSGKGSALPHWTATGWLALLPLSALGLQHVWRSGVGITGQAVRVVLCTIALLQAMSIVALGLMMATGGRWQGVSLFGSKGNPFADLHGWQGASQTARQLHEANKTNAILVSNWTLASRLAWYARPARVLTLDSKNKQFEMWRGKLKAGDSVIWVNWSQMPLAAPVAGSLFAHCEHIAAKFPPNGGMSQGDRGEGGLAQISLLGADRSSPQPFGQPPVRGALSQFTYYHCTNWQGKP